MFRTFAKALIVSTLFVTPALAQGKVSQISTTKSSGSSSGQDHKGWSDLSSMSCGTCR